MTVGLVRPSSDFVDVVSSPSFGVVPPVAEGDSAAFDAGSGFVGSGGYTATGSSASGLTLTANEHYWAGKPAITTVELVTDIAGKSPVEVFEAGDLDYTPIADSDASWIAYDETIGPQLREVPQFVVEYYGFDTSKPPFDKAEVRQAVAMAVDWRRIRSSGRRRATRRRPPRWSRRASPGARTWTASRSTTPTRPARCSRRPATPAARASRRSRC